MVGGGEGGGADVVTTTVLVEAGLGTFVVVVVGRGDTE